MKMKRFLIVFAALIMTASSMWGKDEEVIVTRQLLLSQRNSLPEKTITVEAKKLTFNKKADANLVNALMMVMDTIAQEDYMNRTFVLLIDPKGDGRISIAAHSDDIVTNGRNSDIMLGDMQHGRCHFVVLMSKVNGQLLDNTFKRQSKVKFVQEFEFVDFKTPNYPTSVIAEWTAGGVFKWVNIVINEDPYDTDGDNSRQTDVRE